MYFLGLLLAISQTLCCWAVDTTKLFEVDLILPRNETYPPSPIFPIIFAVQNPRLAKSFHPTISYIVEQVGGNFSTTNDINLWGINDTSSPHFLSWGTPKYNFEGTFRFRWSLTIDRCFLDERIDEEKIRNFGNFTSLYFTTKNGTSPADFVAATYDDTCDKSPAQAINYLDLTEVPATETSYGTSCLAYPTTLPAPTNPCNIKIDSSAAAIMSADMTSTACERARTGITCPSPSPRNAAPKAHFPMGGVWILAMCTLLTYYFA
jgi:hypothetical protein